MLEEQNHACAICGTTDSGRRRFCIDHNHHTQKVRGLLCDRCNMFVGHAKESVTLMKSFVPYLTKPPRIPARPRIKRNTPARSKARILTESATATKLLCEPALRCIDCEQVLPIESFGKTKGNSTGRKPYCNICEACRRHNITPKEYSIMLEEQGQTCATCSEGFERTARKGKKRSDSQTTRRIDHCHQTGSVRGILCHHCNCALGYVKDSLAKIHAAINYLNDHAET